MQGQNHIKYNVILGLYVSILLNHLQALVF